jgi:uncharacterized protein YdhG (YjbR/CyaY superfamily)
MGPYSKIINIVRKELNSMKMGNHELDYSNIDEYIALFPTDVQATLRKMREVIKGAAPGAEEAIRYGMPTFRLNGNLVHFAAYKTHIGFYPTSSGIAAFQKELSKYEISKGTVRFPLGTLIPYELIERIVKFRVKENMAKGGK